MKRRPSSTTIKAVLIEDSQQDLDDVRRELQAGGDLSVVGIPYEGVSETTRLVTKENPDVILIDFRLVKRQRSQNVEPTQGSTLAALFKEKARMPDTPVFLVSLGRLSQREPLLHIKTEPHFFDDLLIKKEIYDDPKAAAAKIRAVVSGYRILTSASARKRKTLLDLLGAGDAEIDLLMKAEPPTALATGNPWDVTEVAQWIRHTLMAYPGILYDKLTAACFLGLSLDSFASKSIAGFLREARYMGPFYEEADRWWKARLLSKATAFMVDEGDLGPPMEFGRVWRSRKQKNVALSHCNSADKEPKEPADCVCYLLREPVRREYSLPYHPDRRPAVMDEARVSFKAIKTAHERFDPALVAPDARSLVPEIRK